MPFEHEHKYILKDFRELFTNLCREHKQHLIDQFYISDHARFRRVEHEGDPHIKHCFTYKHRIAGRVMEFEQAVSPGDFHHAFQGCIGSLHKVRFKVPGAEPEVAWDIDFLLTERNGEIYFALAEAEHPPGTPYEIPDFLVPHLLMVIPDQDAHMFSNRRLQDQGYTREVVERYRSAR